LFSILNGMSSAPALVPVARLARSLRAHRESAQLSLGALAARSGVSKASISTIEAGTANPSLETLWRLAGSLGISLGALLGEEEPPTIRLLRAGDGVELSSESGLTGRLLMTEGRAHRTEIIQFELPAGADYHSAAHQAGTEEFLYGISGSIDAGPLNREERLRPGDALWFPADLPHRYASARGARCLLALSYPT
jgi:transcriptional regulator with XRE-family HTH domain